MRRAFRGLLFLVGFAAASALGAYAWLIDAYERPSELAEQTTIVVPRGAGPSSIGGMLADRGIASSPWVFVLGTRLDGSARSLKAGEYAIPPGASVADVAALLREGRTVVRRFTVSEGLTSAEILERLAGMEGMEGPVPEAVPPEGTLLPETYHFSLGDSRAEMIGRMQQAMRQALAATWEARADNLPFDTPEEALALAAIIEKETAVAEERPRVAGVFVNRLRRGMPLQSDPTVIYAVTEGKAPLNRPLSRADLALNHPYNTYQVRGLPPGPIANPGRASIAAAVNPEEHDYYYFVADGQGGHAFSRNLADHNRAVAAWRRIERQSRSAAPAAGSDAGEGAGSGAGE